MDDRKTNLPTLSRVAAGACAIGGVALLALLGLPAAAAASTDPDVDPAEPIAVTVENGGGTVAITAAKGYLQVTAEGLRYLRIDYEVTNPGEEAIRGHRWRLSLGGAEAEVSVGGLLEPGASARA